MKTNTLMSKVESEAGEGWSGDAVCVSVAVARAIAEKGDKAIAECERLTAWLLKIEGGDHPCKDEAQLRQWAYNATTLHHDAPA